MKTYLMGQLISAGVITILLQKVSAFLMRAINHRQSDANASKTEADATQVIASTLLSSLVDPLKHELERLRHQVEAVTSELESARIESQEKDRLALAHLVWCMKMRQHLAIGEEAAPKLWPELMGQDED